MSNSRDEDRLLDHQYDEIQEYDNPTPGWWTWIFVATILWGALYFFNVIPGIGTGKGRVANYDSEMAAAKAKYGDAQAPKQASVADAATVLASLHDPAALAAGKEIFTTNCVSCHRADLGGQIGPNLTDDFWIHGNKPQEILTTISNGVPDKGMPTWSAVLKPEQLAKAAAYVISMHGTHPAAPKEPQGVKLEWEASGESGASEHAHGTENHESGEKH
jgi:cytochrome c oxidase cbb3-type subunit 3